MLPCRSCTPTTTSSREPWGAQRFALRCPGWTAQSASLMCVRLLLLARLPASPSTLQPSSACESCWYLLSKQKVALLLQARGAGRAVGGCEAPGEMMCPAAVPCCCVQCIDVKGSRWLAPKAVRSSRGAACVMLMCASVPQLTSPPPARVDAVRRGYVAMPRASTPNNISKESAGCLLVIYFTNEDHQ